ncbi:MAG: hypothetical protein CEE38_23695 [Planctomycetes bacterium B3_Pla]|nr:MAG: hypothetical protein CEE38_23695 [Planctomycetes bacterium B3_Pla]
MRLAYDKGKAVVVSRLAPQRRNLSRVLLHTLPKRIQTPAQFVQAFRANPATIRSAILLRFSYIKSSFTVRYRSIFDAIRDFLHDEAFAGQRWLKDQ